MWKARPQQSSGGVVETDTLSTSASAVISLADLSLTYPGPVPVAALKQCNLVVERGDYVTVVGPSGSGKSTLLNVIGLLDRPTTGTYTFGGVNTGALSENERAAIRGRRIGFVFQAFHLLDDRSATENVMLGLLYRREPDRYSRSREYLERVGLAHRLDVLPSTMSGGERQRVAIARALVGEPSLLLCDEPTGNLDSSTATTIMSLLDGLHQDGTTILLITHDERIADHGQRRVRILDGTLDEI